MELAVKYIQLKRKYDLLYQRYLELLDIIDLDFWDGIL